MSLWTRIANALRPGDRLNRDIDEELESHLTEALEQGRDAREARKAFGSQLRQREKSRDIKLLASIDSLRSDAVFGWRQLMKHKVTSVAPVLSLALGVGACTTAFRLIDALLLRPLPVSHPERLFAVTRFGSYLVDRKAASFDGWAHPAFLQLRTAVKDEAELLAISYIERVESAWISSIAATLGGMFAWWAAPFVVRMINPPDNPARLYLPWDWRVFGFALGLTLIVTVLFGLIPALRASSVQPSSALKGGDDPHSRRRLMQILIAAQAAFCFVVLFVAGLFGASFEKLSNRPTGFSSERLLMADIAAHTAQPPVVWTQAVEHLSNLPGVERTSLMSWPLMVGYAWMTFVSTRGEPPGKTMSYMLSVSPGWIDTMKVPLIDGRDLGPGDVFGDAAIVNETFARQFFNGENPVGKSFVRTSAKVHTPIQIVGLVRDAIYRDVHEPILPVAFMPFPSPGDRYTLAVRTARGVNPLSIAPLLRKEVSRARADFRVTNIHTQEEINQAQTVRERLLALVALVFAAVALLLAGVGLYGVLDYTVLQRRRELGIRLAIGAPVIHIARLVSVEVFAVVTAGAAAGCALGIASARYIESLFFEVKPTDPAILAIPSLIFLGVVILAALRPVIQAIRIDPVMMLRAD